MHWWYTEWIVGSLQAGERQAATAYQKSNPGHLCDGLTPSPLSHNLMELVTDSPCVDSCVGRWRRPESWLMDGILEDANSEVSGRSETQTTQTPQSVARPEDGRHHEGVVLRGGIVD